MSCEEIRQEFGSYLDNELPTETRKGLEAHLASCNSCTMELKGFRKTLALIDSWKDSVPDTDIYGKIQHKLVKPAGKPIILRLTFASAAAAIVAFVLLRTISPIQHEMNRDDVANERRVTDKENAVEKLGKSGEARLQGASQGEGNTERKITTQGEKPAALKVDTDELLALYKPPSFGHYSYGWHKGRTDGKMDDDKHVGKDYQGLTKDVPKEDAEKLKEFYAKELREAMETVDKVYRLDKAKDKKHSEKEEDHGSQELARLKTKLMELEEDKTSRVRDEVQDTHQKRAPEKKESGSESISLVPKNVGDLLQMDVQTPYGFFSVFIRKGQVIEPTNKTIARDGKIFKIMTYTNANGYIVTIISHELDWKRIEPLRGIF